MLIRVPSLLGADVDGAIRPVSGTPHRARTGLSATVFLSEPEDYDGGDGRKG